MSSGVLRVGVIGTGVGIRTLLPGFRRTGRAEIVALSGSSDDRARAIGDPLGIPLTSGDFRAVCEADVDLICVASPNDLHVEHAVAALKTGRHVYLEKPTGMSTADAEHIAETAAATPARLVVVGHQLRFNPYMRTLRDLVRDQKLGRVYHLELQQHGSGFARPDRPWTWEFEPSRGGGVRLAMGSHLIDLAQFLLDGEVASIAAELDPVHRTRRPDGGDARECFVSNYFSALATIGSAAVHVSTTAAAHSGARFDITAYGELGDATFDLGRLLQLHRVGDEPLRATSDETDAEYRHRQASSIFSTSFTYFADEIVDALVSGRTEVQDASTPWSAARYMRVLDAALASDHQATRELLAEPSTDRYY